MYHSQHFIEVYLDKYFKTPGTFLEIGAWHGDMISQTEYLEQEQGWKGVCVDPFPWGFENRTCQLVSKAVSKDGLPRPFIKVSVDKRDNGDVSYFSGFKDSVQTHLGLILAYCAYEEIEVPTITIDQLYADCQLPQHIEFLSVDTEGSEVEIFESIDFTKYMFDLIVFEHNEDPNTVQLIGRLLTFNGYEPLDHLRCDDIYIRKEFHANHTRNSVG